MKQISPIGKWILFASICLPVLYTLSIYASLPDSIPIHFNIKGEADRWGGKDSIWLTTLIFPFISVIVYLLLTNISKIDPKKTAGQSPDVMQKIANVIVIFLCVINLAIIHASQAGSFNLSKFMLPMMGLLFMILGNYMNSIKPNYFVGFRLPWTLENEDNWRKTHQLVGKVWVAGGFLNTIVALILPVVTGFIVFFSITALMVFIPAVYSYRYYIKHKQS
jgi:uncharacterized membrane protein